MSFLYPYFLFAAAVLAIPVIVHLFQFRRYKTIYFPSLRFLRKIEFETRNRNRLKHLLVMTLRCLAFLCLVLAFAIPVFRGNGPATAARPMISIFVDNSFSMDQRGQEGILFETAREKAREVVRSARKGSRFQVMSQNPGAINLRFVEASEAIQLIDELKVSSRSQTLEQVMKRMGESLQNAEAGAGSIYIISDFQKSALGSFKGREMDKYPVYCIKPVSGKRSNLSLDSAWLGNPYAMAGDRNRIVFRLRNYGDKALEDVAVHLRIANGMAGLARVSVEAAAVQTGQIEFRVPTDKEQGLELSVDDPDNAFDNSLYIVINPLADLPVLHSAYRSNPYVDASLKTNAFIDAETAGGGSVARWPDHQSWVISDATSAAGFEQGVEFVKSGGRLIVSPGLDADPVIFAALQKGLGLPQLKQKKVEKLRANPAGLSQPFFSNIFDKIPANMEMPRFSRYLASDGANGNGVPILSLENGDPLLLMFSAGKGRMYFFTCALDPAAGNLVQSSLFFPLITNCIVHSDKASHLYGISASGQGYLLHREYMMKENNLQLRQGKEEYVPEILNSAEGQELYIGNFLEKAGFYSLQDRQQPGHNEMLALNYSRRESDPGVASGEMLKDFQTATEAKWIDAGKTFESNAAEAGGSGLERHLFIWLAAAFFALEILVLVFWDELLRRSNKTLPAT